MASQWTPQHTQLTTDFTRNGRIFGLFSDSERSTTTESWFPQGLDPVEFLKLSRQNQPSGGQTQRRKKNRRRLVAQESRYGSKKKKRKEILEINKVPRAEFLIPGDYVIFCFLISTFVIPRELRCRAQLCSRWLHLRLHLHQLRHVRSLCGCKPSEQCQQQQQQQ